MTELVELQTSDLTGPALRWAVAQVEGLQVELASPCYGTGWRIAIPGRDHTFRPDVDWSQGGPLLEKYFVTFGAVCTRPLTEAGNQRRISAHGYKRSDDGITLTCRMAVGPTILVAGCRAIVRAHLGDTLQVPKELAE